MSTSQYSYHPFHSIGAAQLQLFEPAALGGLGAWRNLGRCADAAVLISGDFAEKGMAIGGVSQPIARRPRSRRYSLSLRMLETAGPEAAALLFGEGALQQRLSPDILVQAESLRLYGSQAWQLAHPYGLLSSLPPGATGPSLSAGGSGGLIAASTWHYWIVPCLSYSGQVQFEGSAVYAGSVNVSAGQQVSLSFTAPASWSPDAWRIYFNSSNNLSGALLALQTSSGSPILIGSHAGSPAYSAQSLPLFKLRSYDNFSSYSAGSDYSLNAARGSLSRIEGGALASGKRAVALYAHWTPAAVDTPLGDCLSPERYRRIRLLQLAPQDPQKAGLENGDLDTGTWRETGVQFEFHRVAISPGETRWPFADNDFGEGASLLWDCMYDGASSAVGTVRSSFGVLAQWE
ncbi:hypothetical protein IT575_01185 [bacterium]|nr:hypothetical protein [bacterium]